MISQALNDRLTLTGPGTPAGRVMRHYWMPAALSDELLGARPVVPVTLLGERLVLFRDEAGELGLIDRHCPHRGADLAYGRLEDCGLRCPFHGWHFDRTGQCVEQPGEPEGSRMHERIRATAYPVTEHAGVIWAYMGDGAPPPLPDLDCFRAPGTHVFAFKGLWECNWLQALEVGIDPAHASFLHRFLQDEDPADGYGKQFRDGVEGAAEIPMTKLLRDHPRPEIMVDDTPYGLSLTALRHLPDGRTHVRVTNQVFPCAIVIPMSREMTITQWHVPVDDSRCYWFSLFTSFRAPVDKVRMREQRLAEHHLPSYRPKKNRTNDYGYDPEEQGRETYTGMGLDINVHDQWAVEGMGAIQDRTKEHLASTDKGIVANRRALRAAMDAVEAGEAPPPSHGPGIAGPISLDTIAPAGADWAEAARQADRARRAACPWDATVPA
ncbi:aromatic ring-hydroxylating dioxygenase subunit alpha [Jannaschia sp. Os4]|uniref:aromatic ring-hydroxylating dioxygenase subunit alpha n=1 Tax=Jannaschia sp. Os4 TaxID=2807617 RepID=UPI00193ADBE4|nr:aromatic ring-hydroxylating dioxygenase subunit alpha [Jannaschia sp. Os4]MBM2576707.1 aromatic ring-hydroxylating dioxygenase subunit alpha [Jannaschia sp. Os4]